MATVNRLLLEQASFEKNLSDLLATVEKDDAVVSAVRIGFSAASVAATHCIMDLAVKGVLPDGIPTGRIMTAVREAIEDSLKRIMP